MQTDRSLIAACRKAAKEQSLTWTKQQRDDHAEAVEGAITDYESASYLSRGPDPDRCSHWERKAAWYRRRMCDLVGLELPEDAGETKLRRAA